MERELWRKVYRLLLHLAPSSRPHGHVFSDAIIAAVYLWSVVHDRPVSWATNPKHWPTQLLDFTLPTQSTLSRRLRSARVRLLIDLVEEHLRAAQPTTLIKCIDSKPLAVGTYSRCRDARWGEAVRTKLRGYKYFAIYGTAAMPLAWDVSSMNASESRVSRRLLPRLKDEGYVLGDAAFDVNRLYDIAAAHGHQLIAKRKTPHANIGPRARHPNRLRSIDLLEGPGVFGRQVYRYRTSIERQLARLTNIAGGLSALPNWVRRLPCVKLHVQAKLILLALRVPPKSKRYKSNA